MGKQSFIIGRAGHIALYDDTVSRRHACLDVEDGNLTLRDLKSRNGTYEIRDKKLVPFTSGVVLPDQVFAFGECVRSVAQLLSEAGVSTDWSADDPGGHEQGAEVEAESETPTGFRVPAQRRLTHGDIIAILEQIEDHLAQGGQIDSVCARLGITQARYGRWCTEHGATREERSKSLIELARENARLRALVADLAADKHALEERLTSHGLSIGEPAGKGPDHGPNFTIVGGDLEP